MSVNTEQIEKMKSTARGFNDVVEGTSCNQSSFKRGKNAFFYAGPGAKGIGFKAMFKLDASVQEAMALADKEPKHYEVGKHNWVTARFSEDQPMPENRWQTWLEEAYQTTK